MRPVFYDRPSWDFYVENTNRLSNRYGRQTAYGHNSTGLFTRDNKPPARPGRRQVRDDKCGSPTGRSCRASLSWRHTLQTAYKRGLRIEVSRCPTSEFARLRVEIHGLRHLSGAVPNVPTMTIPRPITIISTATKTRSKSNNVGSYGGRRSRPWRITNRGGPSASKAGIALCNTYPQRP
jgi:hypothetical protein